MRQFLQEVWAIFIGGIFIAAIVIAITRQTYSAKKYFKTHIPSRQSVEQNRWLRPLAHWLQHPNLWHLHRRSVSGGVAVGLFCGLIPGPLQMLGAAVLSMLFRVNLPIALLTTLYTNPFTILPLYVLAYKLGTWVLGQGAMGIAQASCAPHFNDEKVKFLVMGKFYARNLPEMILD